MIDLKQYGFDYYIDPVNNTSHWKIGNAIEGFFVSVSYTKTKNFNHSFQKRHNIVQKNWYIVWGDSIYCFGLFFDDITHIDWQAIADVFNSELDSETKVLLVDLIVRNTEDFTPDFWDGLSSEYSFIRTHDEWYKYSEKYRELYKVNELHYEISQIPMRDFIDYVIENNQVRIEKVKKFQLKGK